MVIKFKFYIFNLNAEELSLPQTLNIKITSSSITIYDLSYPDEKIILTVPTPREYAAEAIGFEIQKSSE